MLPMSVLSGEALSTYTIKDRKRINPFLLCSMKCSSANDRVRKNKRQYYHTHDQCVWGVAAVRFEMGIASLGNPKETQTLNIYMTISTKYLSLMGVITFEVL